MEYIAHNENKFAGTKKFAFQKRLLNFYYFPKLN